MLSLRHLLPCILVNLHIPVFHIPDSNKAVSPWNGPPPQQASAPPMFVRISYIFLQYYSVTSHRCPEHLVLQACSHIENAWHVGHSCSQLSYLVRHTWPLWRDRWFACIFTYTNANSADGFSFAYAEVSHALWIGSILGRWHLEEILEASCCSFLRCFLVLRFEVEDYYCKETLQKKL